MTHGDKHQIPKRKFFGQTIRVQLFLLVLLAVLPSLGIILNLGIDEHRTLIREARLSSQRFLNNLAISHAYHVDLTRQLLSLIASSLVVKDNDIAGIEKLLGNLHRQNTRYTTMSLADRSGEVIASAVPFSKINVADRKYFQDVLRTRDFSVGEFVIDRTVPKPVLHFAYPVLAEDGTVQSVVIVGLDLTRFDDLLPGAHLPRDSELELFDYRGIRLFDTSRKDLIGKPDLSDLFRRMQTGGVNGTFTAADRRGVERLYVYQQFRLEREKAPYLFMRVSFPQAPLDVIAQRHLADVLGLLIMAALLALLVARLLGHYGIMRRLDLLVASVKEMSRGNLSVRTGMEHSGNEFNELAQVFDEMGDAFEKRENERKQAEEALRESEEQYRILIETTATGYVIIDTQGKVVDANSEYVRLTGYHSLEDIRGRSVIEWTAEHEKKKNSEAVAQCIRVGYIKNFETDYVDQNGKITPIEINATVIGKRILTLCRDITERKQVGNTLRESEERFRQIFNNMAEGVAIYQAVDDGQDFVFVDVNEAAQILSKINKKEDMGRRVTEKFPGVIEMGLLDVFRRVWRTGTSEHLPQKLYRDERIQQWVENYVCRLPSGLIVAIYKDVTTRKQVEEALRESEMRFSTVFRASPVGVALSRMSDNKFVDVNDAIIQIFGYAREEILGRTSQELGLWPYSEERDRMISELIKHGHVRQSEVRFRRKSGEVRDALISLELVNLDGQEHLLGVVSDNTERKRIEESLLQSEKRYRQLLASTTDYIYTVRVENGRAAETSHGPGCVAVTGYSSEEYKADPYLWYRMVYPNDREKVADLAARAIRGEDVKPLEHRIYHKDGEIYWLRDTVVVRRDANGKVIGYDGLVSDVTERKRAEEAVLNSVSLLKATLESTADGILVVDEKGKILDYNEKFFQLWRLPKEVLEARDDKRALEYAVNQMARPKVFLDKVHALYNQPDAESFDILDFKDGRVFERYSRPLLVNGRPVGRVWSFRDVTEKRNAEEAKRKAGDRLEKINNCLLKLGSDHAANIDQLTGLCGELLNASCALYNCMDGDLLCALGRWHTPSDFKVKDDPAGHICYDVIRGNKDDAVIITDLIQTPYFQSDPNVRAYGLRTYMGHAVKCEGMSIGSLCVVYQTPYQPSDDDRRILGIIASAIGNEDTRRRAEEALRASEEKFRNMADHAPIMIGVTDEKGKITFLNKTWLDFRGKTLEEEAGWAWAAGLHPQDRDRTIAAMQAAIDRREPYSLEYQIQDRLGHYHWLLDSAIPLSTPDGQLRGYIGTALNITDRKKAEEVLEQYRKNLEEQVKARTEELARVNKQLITEKHDLEMANQRLSEEGERIMRVMTELEEANQNLRLAQVQLIQSEKMASLGRLAAGVAHEINNPMAYISTNIAVLDKYAETINTVLELYVKLEDILQDTQSLEVDASLKFIRDFKDAADLEQVLSDFRKLIAETNEGAERVKKIVFDLRAFAREDKEGQEVADIQEIIDRALTITGNKLKYKIDVIREYEGLPSILCYPRQLEQVFINLLVNAAEAITEYGKIFLRTYQKDRSIVIEVADTGCGIRESDLPHVFDPFFTTKGVGQGTGLGLSIVYNIIQKHRGEISIKSALGEGTTFIIRIPIKVEQAPRG